MGSFYTEIGTQAQIAAKIGNSKTRFEVEMPTTSRSHDMLLSLISNTSKFNRKVSVNLAESGLPANGKKLRSGETGKDGDFTATYDRDFSPLISDEGLILEPKSTVAGSSLEPLSVVNMQERARSRAKLLAQANNQHQAKISVVSKKDDVFGAIAAAKKYNLKSGGNIFYGIFATGYTSFLGSDFKPNSKEFNSSINTEDWISPDPNRTKYEDLEGPIRIQNQNEPQELIATYLAGGFKSRPDIGFKATVRHALAKLKDGSLSDKAIGFLNEALADAKIAGEIQKNTTSKLLEIDKLTNENILQAAYGGDILAKAFCYFQIKRMAERVKHLLTKEYQDFKPDLFVLNGSFVQALMKLDGGLDLFRKTADLPTDLQLEVDNFVMDGTDIMFDQK